MFAFVLDNHSISSAVLLIILSLITYFFVVAIYRLYFHPLSRFPGPKLAAATQLYELYYDGIKGAQFFLEIQRLHKIYGKSC